MGDRKRILIAEDDPELLEVLEIFLTRLGYEVVKARDGREALAAVQAQAVDLMILDVMMPYLDGYHVAREVSSKMPGRVPPILILTSRDVERERNVVRLSGADAVVQKPFEMEDLRREIENLLNRKGA
ncbi:MAG: response regulator transcription factor [Elusimicrobia bacterium]|nr:response regulator transcription factor [Elusimicrobiota bacterium]